MTKAEFKAKWEADEATIILDDVADCAKEWGITSSPRTQSMPSLLYKVLIAAGVVDAEDYNPDSDEDDDYMETA